jgi:hypothetical protein
MTKNSTQVLKCYTKGFTNFARNAELREVMRKMYLEKYCGKRIVNQNTGITILFDREGAKKTTKGGSMYAEKAALITILDKICKYGILLSIGNRKPTDKPKVLGYLNFKAEVWVDDKLEPVNFSVRIMKDGSFHYHIDIPIEA